MSRFFLVDCNNFFVSCERVFNPTLIHKPVVVLSSNDACIIARSNEAKALGIPMGIPAFQVADLVKKHNVITLSSNFPLYGDMSARVMHTLTEFASDIEIYSVDEAFLFISQHNADFFSFHESDLYHVAYGRFIRNQVKQRTGIPASIGIGPTKTLAKIANRIAKKNPAYDGVFDITRHAEIDKLLAAIDVRDIWGVGYRYARLLHNNQIHTAKDFKYACEKWVRKKMTIMGLKTLLELRGSPCLTLEDTVPDKQSLCVSRSFGKTVTTLTELKEAVSTYIQIGAEKLRKQQSAALRVTVFVVFTRYHDENRYYDSLSQPLEIATSYSPTLIAAAHNCLEILFKQGARYKKAGILFTDLVSTEAIQMHAYTQLGNLEKQGQLMHIIDQVNKKWGRNTVCFASAGTTQPWKMRQLKKSQGFTTNWHEILTIEIK